MESCNTSGNERGRIIEWVLRLTEVRVSVASIALPERVVVALA